MKIQVLVPSQNQKRFNVEVSKDETVAALRRLLMKLLGMLEDTSFSLIALGKIMLDHCQDGTPARLFSTYRVRDKSTVFVHLYSAAKKRKRPCKRIVIFAGRKRQKTCTVQNINTITLPFDNFVCPTCNNDTRQETCPDCGCVKCLLKTGDPVICDQCNSYWHLECAGLTATPKSQYWFCPECYNGDHEKIIGKNEQLHSSNIKTLTIRGKECAIVPHYHIGKIPGVYVGQTWATRELMAEWGIHRAPMRQIFGCGRTGVVSIMLVYGIKEDRDDGDEFVLSGVGGNAKIKSVHSNEQIGSQELQRANLHLAITCNAPVDTEYGGIAIDWKKSQPIRVCRASTLKAIHPEFAPTEGFRYDGEYKIVKYWPFTEPTTGSVIWKFLFRRDDSELPPWSADGKRLSTRRGLRLINAEDEHTEQLRRFTFSYSARLAIEKDVQNRRLWDQISEMEFWSDFEFIQYIFDEAFACSSNACSKPIKDPITTPCGHICCMQCLLKSKSNICFTCRSDIPLESIQVNRRLARVLRVLNPAYGKPEFPDELPSSISQCQLDQDPPRAKKVKVVVESLEVASETCVQKQGKTRNQSKACIPTAFKYEPRIRLTSKKRAKSRVHA